MRIVLAGQPNSGKSTIFNAVAGYRAGTANFPGSSVSYTLSRAIVLGREVNIVDLPGIYSLTSTDAAEREALTYLLENDPDVIINVVDATRLGRSLELTLQLMDLGKPMVVALNMLDEARRKGIDIDEKALAAALGIPVVPTIGRRGQGLKALFREAMRAGLSHRAPSPASYDNEVERAVGEIERALEPQWKDEPVPARFFAIKAAEGDPEVIHRLAAQVPGIGAIVDRAAAELEKAHGWTADQVVSGSRHTVAHEIEDRVAVFHRGSVGWREMADRVLLHPVTGGPLMALILFSFFYAVFGLGKYVENPLVALFDGLGVWIASVLPPATLAGTVARGVVMGVSGGVAIVLPYLIPFLFGLAILEDTGYLPRMAYILDNLMHRMGLHGKSVVPLMLGYGCSVPAVMSTRILESPRDRRITTALTVLIPCSARTTIIYAVVGAYMGAGWAFFVYILNLVVVGALGTLLSGRMKGRAPGLILEIPDLRLPAAKTLLAKTWLSLREFIVIAWPLLIASSAVLGVLEWAHGASAVNAALSPLTVALLGLPSVVGVTLIFGVLRKELTVLMLIQAIGTTNIAASLSPAQMMTFTVFVVFYIPCVATIAVMLREVGWKDTAWISAMTIVMATVLGVVVRFAFAVL
ncbi:MAG: ferrous iron transport protein B [Acidobacteria bacterium]|nr:ferrous iron transport protein B [Acidobacteriota bacterium]